MKTWVWWVCEQTTHLGALRPKMRVFFRMCHPTLPGEGPLGQPAAIPGWGASWLDFVGTGRCEEGTCWVSITAETMGEDRPPALGAWAWPLSQLADSPAQRAHSEPRQRWRPQERVRASGGKGNSAQQPRSTAGQGWTRPHHTGCWSGSQALGGVGA